MTPKLAGIPGVMMFAPAAESANVRSEYRRALDWLLSFANFELLPADAQAAAKFRVDRMRTLLARLGNPHEKFASVHIAGSKGKGSTASICESIMRAAGLKTGLYTSPHLHTFRERIRIAGELVGHEEVVAGIGRLQAIQPDLPGVTVFELITALAFDLFARAGVECAVVEVGIGGRLDATNVITPLVAVITPISYEHTAVLGNTLEAIAGEKAGIIKPGVPVVSAPQAGLALRVFEQVAAERGSPLVLVGRDWQWQLLDRTLDYQDFRAFSRADQLRHDQKYRLHLLGPHQLDNATTAIATSHLLAERGILIPGEAIRDGVAAARWPGRVEILKRSPLVIADGAHNRDSAERLVETLNANWPQARLQWIFGSLSDKDIGGMLDVLLHRSPDITLTRAAHPRSADPESIAGLVLERGTKPQKSEGVAEALATALRHAEAFDATVVTGSLFVVAEARELLLKSRGIAVETDD